MDSAISRLMKVLALEKKQGFRNKAVIGGLDKFASRWESDARAEVGGAGPINEIVQLLLGYAAVEDTAARERILEQVIRRAREVGAPEEAGPPDEPTAPATTQSSARPAEETAIDKGRDRPPEPLVPSLSKPASTSTPEGRPPPVRPGDAAVAAGAEPAPPREGPRGLAPSENRGTEEGSHLPKEVRPLGGGGGLDGPVTRLPSIGPAFAQRLAKVGVRSIRDLLYLLPYRYEDYSQLRTINRLRWGEEVTVIGTVWEMKSRTIGADRRIITARIGDGTGEMLMTWFNPFVEHQLRVGQAYAFSGKIETYREMLTMRNPAFDPLDRSLLSTSRLVPVYHLTEGLSARWLRSIIDRALSAWAAEITDFLPANVRASAGLLPLGEALTQIHFPDGREQLAAAHRRLSFDELFLLQLGVLSARSRHRAGHAPPLKSDDASLEPLLRSLPFIMTAAQRRALSEIAADLAADRPMSRLLQGDVGSGKTAVAAAALWAAVATGAQGAIMAPTEILAEQHARAFGRMFEGVEHPAAHRPVRIVLLSSGVRPAEREASLDALAAGQADIAVGTHALIQHGVTFRRLAVAVVDEQHRFGVEQRAALRQKAEPGAGATQFQPHMLVMSATPIPRSLALTIYGDLDISVIDEMPAGRTPIKTKWLAPDQRERAYDFIRRQVGEGRQAFVICPLVEESTASEAKAAVDEHARLQQVVFPSLRVGLLHGRLQSDEKERVMRSFADGEIDVLVATSVVEVGIDVPNATVIMIEGAERFGLAQLHQFRGRVGRGAHPSYCILVSDAREGESVQRLQALENNNDGFALAQIDLELRGPGDFFGTRQSGLPPLHAAQLSDLRTMEEARAAARHLFDEDPDLARPEHRPLAAQLAAFWQGAGDVS